MTLPEAMTEPTVPLFPVAAQAVGISRDTAYKLALTGVLTDGVPILRVGGKYRVPTAALRRALGLDEPVSAS